ncbi:MAG: hypothetical protein H6773_01870 [Pseudomonadales bacterium]|nr:hypothetical protein [Pseudomonadales bacterium]
MSNDEIAEVFSFISQILGTDPRNRYRASAYEEAGIVIQHQNEQLLDVFKKHTANPAAFTEYLDSLPGIGESISKKLTELFTTGNIASFQKYVAKLPGGMYPLMKIHGIGAKKAQKLAENFDLDDPQTAVSKLLTKAKHGQVQGLTGFGEKSEQALIEALELQHGKARIPYNDAFSVAKKFKTSLEDSGLTSRIVFLGSLRREAPTVGDIDVGVATHSPKKVADLITSLPFVKKTLVAGDNLVSVITDEGWQVDTKFAPLAEWGSFIQHFTGDKQHNIVLRQIALKQGFSLSEHGIKIKVTGEVKTFESEDDFYAFLGFAPIPPSERVGRDEFEKYKK